MRFLMDRQGKRRVKHRLCFFAVVLLLLPSVFVYWNANRQIVLSVPYISQKGKLATGCELVSTAMVLNYYGESVSVEDVVAKTPHTNLTETKNGLTGSHPSQFFIGNPYSPDGFGCYAPVVTAVMNAFLSESGKKAINLTGAELEELARDRVANGSPVILWATMNMKEPRPGKSWTLTETGETFRWIAGEHCLVLVGFDKDSYFFNDPYDSNGVISFDKELVKTRYESLGKQAVAVEDGAA